MGISLRKACEIFGVAPKIWMVQSPFKIYEFFEVVSKSGLNLRHSILDFGCGNGILTLELARRCKRVIGIDISENAITVARKFIRHSYFKQRVNFLCTRIEESGLATASMDMVFSFSVLEHIKNIEEVLREVFRILKPGGWFHASVDSLANLKDEALLFKHQSEHSVVQYFTVASLRRELERTGFRVANIYPILTSTLALKEFQKDILYGN